MWRSARRVADSFAQIRQYHGGAGALRWLVQCSLQRIGFWRTIVMWCDLRADRKSFPTPEGFEGRLLTANEVRAFSAQPECDLSPEMAERIERGLDICVGLLEGDQLASYVFYAFDSIEPEHSSGISMSFPRNCAYSYKGFTLPQYRGQGLAAVRTEHAQVVLRDMNISQSISLMEWTNPAAIRYALKSGWVPRGSISSLKWGRVQIRIPSPGLRRLGLRVGRAANVRRRADVPSAAVPRVAHR
jgi:hypothetical protein